MINKSQLRGDKMLKISFNATENTLKGIDTYFNFNYLDEWFEDDLVKQMIEDVDKSKVLSPNCIESPVLGQIPPTKLSGGVKALILMLKQPELEIWATACGDNCAKWIVEISKIHTISIVLEHFMQFPYDFHGICTETDERITTLDDYRRCAINAISAY